MEENTEKRKYTYTLKEVDFKHLFENISDDLLITCKDESDLNYQGVTKKNGIITIKDAEIIENISIKDVLFENINQIQFDNVKIKSSFFITNFQPASPTSTFSFTFRNSKLNNLYFSKSSNLSISIIGNIENDGKEENEIDLETLEIFKSNITEIDISNSKFKQLNVKRNSQIGLLKISNSFGLKLSLENSILEHIVISESIINPKYDDFFNFSNCNIGEIYLLHFGFYKLKSLGSKIDLFSTTESFFHSIEIRNSTINRYKAYKNFGNTFEIDNSEVNYLELLNCQVSSIKPLRNIKIVNINACEINRTSFEFFFLPNSSVFTFYETHFYHIDMDNFSILGNLYFRNTHILNEPFKLRPLEWLYDKNEKLIPKTITEKQNELHRTITEKDYNKLKEIKEKIKAPTISISSSSLGKTEFTDFPWAKFAIEFSNSKITDCFVSGGSIPKDNVHIIGAENNPLKDHEQKASFYNQFKKIFEAQGDIYHATQFQAKWAEEQKELLKLIRKKEKGWFTTTFSDLWVLRLNKWSNLHGESWPLAFVFLIGVGLVFYLLYLLSITRLFNGNPIDWNLFGYFFEFLNPTHKLNFIEGNSKITGWTVTADYIGRIFIAYGIYQFIAAFRKHTKKQ